MKIFVEGTLIGAEDKSFAGKDGKHVNYWAYWVRDSEGKVCILGSTLAADTKHFDKEYVFECELTPDFQKPTLFRLSVKKVTVT